MRHLKFANAVSQELLGKIPKNVNFELHNTRAEFDFDSLVITKSNCIFIHHDILCNQEFDYYTQTITPGAQKYLDLINRYPDTNFVLMYGSRLAERELSHDRLKLIRYTSALAQQKEEYQTLNPVNLKNLNSKKNFICLNRHPRQHRINLVSYLLGLNLDLHGTISFGETVPNDMQWIDRVSWELTDNQIEKVKPILLEGFNRIKKLDLSNTISEVGVMYSQYLKNAENFDLHLRGLYQDHFVEIVSETLFTNLTVGISEKFLNSIYGYVFPIVIGSCGAVQVLSDLGFDMFKDIVDHSYDTISNPLDRLCSAINLNESLLTDNQKTKDLWQKNYHRFENNINFAKNKMYEVIRTQALDDFAQVTWKF